MGAANDNDGNELDQTGPSADTVRGDIEQLLAGEGPDVLFGDSSDETLIGGGGPDRIFGGSGNDAMLGGFGDDFLSGSMTATTCSSAGPRRPPGRRAGRRPLLRERRR